MENEIHTDNPLNFLSKDNPTLTWSGIGFFIQTFDLFFAFYRKARVYSKIIDILDEVLTAYENPTKSKEIG